MAIPISQDTCDCLFEYRRIFSDDYPNGLQIHTHILVDQNILETDDRAPRYVGTLSLQGSWDLSRSLPGDLKISYHCILPTLGIALNLSYRFDDMDAVEPIVAHSGATSRQT